LVDELHISREVIEDVFKIKLGEDPPPKARRSSR